MGTHGRAYLAPNSFGHLFSQECTNDDVRLDFFNALDNGVFRERIFNGVENVIGSATRGRIEPWAGGRGQFIQNGREPLGERIVGSQEE